MHSMTVESTIIQIISKHMRLPEAEITHETQLSWSLMNEINNDVCFALLANINTIDALACKTVGQYLLLATKDIKS